MISFSIYSREITSFPRNDEPTTDQMSLPKKQEYQRLIHFIATILHAPEHFGNLYRSDDLVSILALTLGSEIDSCVADIIDGKLLVRAFANSDGQDDYALLYEDAFGFDGDSGILYVR